MTNNDLNQIGSLIDKKLSATEDRLKREIALTEERLDKKISSTEEKLKIEISSVEERMNKEIDATKEELLASDKKIMVDIGTFMEDTLFPMIDEKADKSDIDRIERKLDRVLDASLDHGRRIKDIESVPVVAHDLKHSS
ncbi:hypothetical protein HYT74_02115 [Candidatus Daviesbacteria bacterium]|nr:hypothetical protein [Candidatus Daviesbacteria bacterium]